MVAQPNKFRSRLAVLEIVLLVAGFLSWAAVPFGRPIILVPLGWMLIGGAISTMAIRFAHWAVERVSSAKNRLGMK